MNAVTEGYSDSKIIPRYLVSIDTIIPFVRGGDSDLNGFFLNGRLFSVTVYPRMSYGYIYGRSIFETLIVPRPKLLPSKNSGARYVPAVVSPREVA